MKRFLEGDSGFESSHGQHPIKRNTLPDLWRRVVIMRDVKGQSPTEVSAGTGLTADQQRDVLNRARESIRQAVSRALEPDADRS